MSIIDAIKGNIAVIAVEKAERNRDGVADGMAIQEQIDKTLKDKYSDKVLRGPVTSYLLELIEGMYEKDYNALKELSSKWMLIIDQKRTKK